MKEIDSNKEAWSKLSLDHYNTYKRLLSEGRHRLNSYIEKELGDIGGKSVIHLQCNTGADTLLLAQKAKHVTGVDLVPENIYYARRLAEDMGIKNADFIESDIMKLSAANTGKYDMVFTSEGVLGWLPDLRIWAEAIRGLLKDDGILYVFDSHPFYLSLDESKLKDEIYEIKYPYFGKQPDTDESIGGYASEVIHGVKAYFWMHTVSDIINAVTNAGMHVEFFNEFPENFCDPGGMKPDEEHGLYNYDYNTDKYPMSFSLRASVYKR